MSMPTKPAPSKSSKTDLYNELEALLKRYSPPFTPCPTGKVGQKRSYGLWSEKEVEIGGKKVPQIYFASLIEQKGYVGFYYAPVYMNPEIKKDLPSTLMKLQKGKSCFHIKSANDGVFTDVKTALDLALKHYKQNGWV